MLEKLESQRSGPPAAATVSRRSPMAMLAELIVLRAVLKSSFRDSAEVRYTGGGACTVVSQWRARCPAVVVHTRDSVALAEARAQSPMQRQGLAQARCATALKLHNAKNRQFI